MAYGTKRYMLPVQTVYNPKHKDAIVDKLLKGNFKLLVVFLLGIIMGRLGLSPTCGDPRSTKIHGSIQHYEDLPTQNTSHGSITKRQFLEAFAVPRVTGFSIATIHPGESVHTHDHHNMHEFFYVLEGEATFIMCNQQDDSKVTRYDAKPGTFWHVEPHCLHGIDVPVNTTSGDLKIFYGGVTDANYEP